MQIQALLAEEAEGREAMPRKVERREGVEVVKPQIFNGMLSKVAEFITACKLYIRMKLREKPVEGQVQWILSYVQGGAADIWKKNVMEELEAGKIEYESAEEFLTSLKKEFGGGEEESVKVAELRKLEQGGRTMEEFVQEFKRAARGSGYKGRPLVEKFKRGINRAIRRKLIEVENQPGSIEQWFRRATALDRNWRESRREEERLREKKEQEGGVPKQDQRQNLPQPLVWQRRQIPSQQATTEPAPMEGVERTNVVVLRGQEQRMGAPPKRDPYAMEVDCGRNCYACRGFEHMACHCRNRGQRERIEQGRRAEYGGWNIKGNNGQTGNLKEVENLESLD